ncbi:MAG: hypothetical protein OXC91_11190 [Rhodobacteraceae bacterium]|nr:hypothetical protein [Paracoccaceae bacterium]
MIDMGPTTNTRALLVEGLDDRKVVENLLDKCNLCHLDIKVEVKGGFDQLRKSISSELKVSGREALGILVDANDDLCARWQSITDQLDRAGAGFHAPPKPSYGGAVLTGSRGIRVGVWLMPDNRSSGELEDFVFKMIPQSDPILPQSMKYIDGIDAGDRKFNNNKITGAYVHAWLATLESPRQMGTAILSGDLNINAEEAVLFVDWIKELYK